MDDKVLKSKLDALKNSRKFYDSMRIKQNSKSAFKPIIEEKSKSKPKTKPESKKETKKEGENKKNKTKESSKSAPKKAKKDKAENKDSNIEGENKKSTAKKEKSKKDQGENLEAISNNNNSDTVRRWNDFKGKETKKGPFTSEEMKKIKDAICYYVHENNLQESDIINLVTEKQSKNTKSIWPKIAECLPDRSVQSIHNFCHRAFNPYNYKGNWSDEEVMKLINLHNEFGSKWEKIGKILERTSTNVKDKWKEIGGKNWELRKKDFDLKSTLKMIKYIDESISVQRSLDKQDSAGDELSLNEEDEEKNKKSKKNKKSSKSEKEEEEDNSLFLYKYKFSDSLQDNKDTLYEIKENRRKMVIDSSLKEEKSRIIIKNLLSKLLNMENLQKLLFDDKNKTEISWTVIADKIKTYSRDDLKNQWNKILKDLNLEKKCMLVQDLKMINYIIKNDYESIEEVNFSRIKNKRDETTNRTRLEEYIAFNDVYNIKSFKNIILQIKEDLENSKSKNENNDEDGVNEREEFEKEMSSKKKIDILKYFREFTNKKRERSDDE